MNLGRTEAAAFQYVGTYRNQSRREESAAALAGCWLTEQHARLSAVQINQALRRSSLWQGSALVRLRAAEVHRRDGVFATADDALYYRRFFNPAAGSDPMPADILDVPKLLDHWVRRRPHAVRVLGRDAYQLLESYVGDIAVTASNEYFCHEAGHATGWAVDSKYDHGYFRSVGKTAWPLIFVEEFRADMQSMAFALEVLSAADARAAFAYHIVHRLGLAAYSARTGADGAGAVPYLLFCLLIDLGLLRVDPSSHTIVVTTAYLAPGSITNLMGACAEHAATELTSVEMSGASPIDIAITAASYFRRRVNDEERGRLYSAWLLAGPEEP